MTNAKTKTERIAELNDLARTAMGVAGKLVQTSGFKSLPPEDQSRIREKVELFSDFKPGNDPYGERDFGRIDHNDISVYWKIDYYDKALEYGSEDPSDPAQTTRVLTLMLREEYSMPEPLFYVFNDTDGILCYPFAMTRQECDEYIERFRKRFARQGYYLTASGHEIVVDEVLLKLVPEAEL